MPIQILMPALSPTMTEGKLAKWMKAEGDSVDSGDVIAEIETDKATMEVEAVDEGTLGKILVAEGTEGVAVNSVIALLLEEGEDASALEGAAAAPPPPAPAAAPAEAPAPAPAAAPAPAPAAPATAPAPPPPAAPSGGRVFASPLARRIAADAGLDLTQISGSGPHRRIVKADVETAIATGVGKAAAPAPEAAAAPAAAPMPAPAGAYTEIPNTTMRKVIAERLSASKREIPHFYLSIDCDIDALMDLRQQLNAKSPEGEGAYKLSVNDFVVRAVALAMRVYPGVNVTWTEDAVRQYADVDVCVAVATPNGLITPVVRNADNKGLAALSNEVKELAGKARDGKLMPEEYQGGGFTISNLGMYSIPTFSAIINPPQSCLMAVGAAEKRPVVKDSALAVATMMTCTLSTDHRTVDGAIGAEFLAVFKRLIEEPLTMLL